MFEFTAQQMQVLQRLVEAGLRPIAIPPYESALCMYRGECAVVLSPVDNGGLRILAPPSFLIDGHFSVRLQRPDGDFFVWKQIAVCASSAKLSELESFRREVSELLEIPAAI